MQVMMQENLKIIGNFQYNPKYCIGEGSFGKVFEGKDFKNGQQVAIKQMDLRHFQKDEYLKASLLTEIEILKKLKNPYIVRLIDIVQTVNSLYIITEFCKDGDLRNFLSRKIKISETEALQFMVQMLKGFKQLEKHKIMHRDLKPANILLHEGKFKIADFGFARFVDNFNTQMFQSCVGSPLYMAPQLLQRKPYTAKCDVWSLGIIFFEMLIGETPYKGQNEQDLLRNILHSNLDIKKHGQKLNLSQVTIDLLSECLKLEEKERLSWDKLYLYRKKIKLHLSNQQQNGILANNISLHNNNNSKNSNVNNNNNNNNNNNTNNTTNNNTNNNHIMRLNQKAQSSLPGEGQEENAILMMLIDMKKEQAFTYFVCVELYDSLPTMLQLMVEDGKLLAKFIIIQAILLKHESKGIMSELMNKENVQQSTLFNNSKAVKQILREMQKESQDYHRFYNDCHKSIFRTYDFLTDKDNFDIHHVTYGELNEAKKVTCSQFLKSSGKKILNQIAQHFSRLSVSDIHQDFNRNTLFIADLLTDLHYMQFVKTSTINFDEVYHEKGVNRQEPKIYLQKILLKIKDIK